MRGGDPQTGLLEYFARQRLEQGLAALDPAAGCNPYPQARVGAVLSEQNPVPRYQKGPDWNAGTAAQSPHSPPLPSRTWRDTTAIRGPKTLPARFTGHAPSH